MTWSSPLNGPAVVPPPKLFNGFRGSDIIDTSNQQDGDNSYFDSSNINPLFSESSGIIGDGFFNMETHGFITNGYNYQQIAAPKALNTIPAQAFSSFPPYPPYGTVSYQSGLPKSPQIIVDHDQHASLPYSPPPLLSRHPSSPGTLAPTTPQL